MGMTYTAFGAPVTTKNLQANADLNLGSYDLICTDAKGDTAEFDEFVGGVGNFSNVLGSGNLDIEGTASIKGNTQIDGNLVLEGAINNVNISDNGEITTSQGVNGADFNGATITSTKFNGATINSSGDYSGRKGTFSGAVTGKSFNGVVLKTSGTITVTPNNTLIGYIPDHGTYDDSRQALTLLPPLGSVKYTGSLKFIANSGTRAIYYNGTAGAQTLGLDANVLTTLSFTNIPFLTITGYGSNVSYYGYTLT